MMLRFLVDVGVGIAVEDKLRELGHDAAAVRDIDPSMKDAEILTWAAGEHRIVLTMDKDFGELVFRVGQGHAGVLLLRLEGATGDQKAAVVEDILRQSADVLTGRFSVYDGALRSRRS